MRNIKVAFISPGNARDIHTWSGTTFHLARSLESRGCDLYYIDNLTARLNFFYRNYEKIYSKLVRFLFGKQYLLGTTWHASKTYAREITRRLPPDTDILFAPAGSVAIAHLKTTKKAVLYTDATFLLMLDYYNECTNLCSKTITEGHAIEKSAFDNCDMLLCCSEWAAASAINDYRISPNKVRIVPFGANIDVDRTTEDIEAAISRRSHDTCNLLFIGTNWERKGGDIALKIASILHDKHINVHLDIVGARDDTIPYLPNYVRNHGFISKATESGRVLLDHLFKNSHFFVLPTRQECFGIVFSEASSYGLPAITTRTGGVSSAVVDNVNGMTFGLEETPDSYAEYIISLLSDRRRYHALCVSSFNEYKTRLNWDVAGDNIITHINEVLLDS